MKKILAVLLAVALVVCCFAMPAVADAPIPRVGDVNDDGVVNLFDVMVVRAHIVAKTYDAAADMNGDDMVDVMDLLMVRNAVLGMEEENVPFFVTGQSQIFHP